MAELKPFHESIVDAINNASISNVACLAALIKRTKIPSNHEPIIKAWNALMNRFRSTGDFGVTQNVMAQQEEE